MGAVRGSEGEVVIGGVVRKMIMVVRVVVMKVSMRVVVLRFMVRMKR